MEDMFGLNKPYDHELKAFGDNWCGPDSYACWKEVLVAQYPAQGDGQAVNVYATAAPARFYRVEVLSGQNSIGDTQPSYEVSTGSGMHEIASSLAEAISEGMIGFEANPKNISR